MKLLPIVGILLIILAIGAAGCTSPALSTSARHGSEPFIGTWQNPKNLVRIQVFENHSVFATADDPCNISESLFVITGYECTSYVFTKGNWSYSPNQTYDVILCGNVTLYGKPIGSVWSSDRYVNALQMNYFYFTYDKATDSISNRNVSWQRISY